MKWLERHRIFLYQNYLVYAIAFFIPCYPRLVPSLIVAFGILSIYAIFKGFSRVQMNEISVLMLILFGFHLTGILYTENMDRGMFNLEVKLSFLAFPIAFTGFKFLNRTNYENTLKAFLIGTILAGVICLAQSAYSVLILDKSYYYFLTSRFSVIVHPSYFSMYLIFAILILTELEWPLFKNENKTRNVLNGVSLLFLTVCVVLSGSKIGMISWLAIIVWITWRLIREFENKWIPIVGLIVISSIIGIVFQSAPLLQKRIMNVLKVAQGENVAPDASESTAVRTLVYTSAWEVIANQPWYGQGTGDFQDALDAEYKSKGYEAASIRHLNAHNQFLQTWITLGIPGFTTLCGIFILLFQRASRQQNKLFIGFALLFLLISLTESSLHMQAGVVFFAFFAIIFARRNPVKNNAGTTSG